MFLCKFAQEIFVALRLVKKQENIWFRCVDSEFLQQLTFFVPHPYHVPLTHLFTRKNNLFSLSSSFSN
jgi:hypothetical protein